MKDCIKPNVKTDMWETAGPTMNSENTLHEKCVECRKKCNDTENK